MERRSKTRSMLEASLDLLRHLASAEATQSAIVEGECVAALVAVTKLGTQAETTLALEILWWMVKNQATHEKIADGDGIRTLVGLLQSTRNNAETIVTIDVLTELAKNKGCQSAVIAAGGHEAAVSMVLRYAKSVVKESVAITSKGASTTEVGKDSEVEDSDGIAASQPESDEFVELADESGSATSIEEPEEVCPYLKTLELV